MPRHAAKAATPGLGSTARRRHAPVAAGRAPAALSRARLRRRWSSVAAILAVLAGLAAVAVPHERWLDERQRSAETMTLTATEATYVVDQQPPADTNGESFLIVGGVSGKAATPYLKFEVPPGEAMVGSATLEVSMAELTIPTVLLFAVPETDWSAEDVAGGGVPVVGDLLAVGTPRTGRDGKVNVSFDVSNTVTAPGPYAFALRGPPMDEPAAIFSVDQGSAGPRLTLTRAAAVPEPEIASVASDPETAHAVQPPPQEIPEPHGARATPPAYLSGGATTTGANEEPRGPEGTPAGGTPAVPGTGPSLTSAPGRILVGATVEANEGEGWPQAYARVDDSYGPLQMIRVFYPGLPGDWPGPRMRTADRPVVVSFKADPVDIIAGKHDAQLAEWFAAAPRGQDVYWSYYHEPEDNIRDGEFTAADYRDAWRRLGWLAEQAGNQRLYATLVLMSWSVDSRSGRNWRDYYPGKDVIAVLGWDVYNLGREDAEYTDPERLFQEVIEISRAEGRPWGVAEFGSQMVEGDESGVRRGAWIRATAAHLIGHGHPPLWVAWFDATVGGEFRLFDEPSRGAWQDFIHSQAS